MLEQARYLTLRRQLAIAAGRFQRAEAALRQHPPNPYSYEADTEAYEAALAAARSAAYRLLDVARNGLAEFDTSGYPDSWHSWQVAASDADAYLLRTDHLVEWQEVKPA